MEVKQNSCGRVMIILYDRRYLREKRGQHHAGEVYWLDGKMYKAANNTDYINVGPATMPTFPFSKNATVDAVIQFTTNLSGLSEEQLSKLFWEAAWSIALADGHENSS